MKWARAMWDHKRPAYIKKWTAWVKAGRQPHNPPARETKPKPKKAPPAKRKRKQSDTSSEEEEEEEEGWGSTRAEIDSPPPSYFFRFSRPP